MTDKPITICIDDIDYYIADDLREYDKNYFFGCSKTSRLIIDKKNIPPNEYKYATIRAGNWKYSTEDFKKSKLIITKKWIETNMPSLSNGYVKEEYDVEPNQIILKDNELFVIDGKNINFPIVGEREYNKCFFRVKDIATFFNSPKLSSHILDSSKDGYQEGLHYIFFIRGIAHKAGNSPNKKILYLTYTGLIRFLFTSRNKIALNFQEWATKILFTHQVGTQEQRQCLVKELVGVDCKYATETLNASVSDISCVYLFVLGQVKKLRKNMTIPDEWDDKSYVCKYGETCDLRRRINEHETTFTKLGCELRLKQYVYVDESNTSKAESELRQKFTDMQVNCILKGHEELIILDKKQLKNTLDTYKKIGILFGANINEFKAKTEKRISDLEHALEIQKKDNELLMKDIELLQMKLTRHSKKK